MAATKTPVVRCENAGIPRPLVENLDKLGASLSFLRSIFLFNVVS